MLARSPGFAATVVLILGLGIGATTTMLSVVDAVLLRPCPYPNSDRLVSVYETDSATKTLKNYTSRAALQDWRERSHAFAPLVGTTAQDLCVQTSEGSEETRAMLVSPEFFAALGAEPILGRTFLPEEERPGGDPVVVLSYWHWRRWFHGNPDVVGKTLIVDRQAHTVVGVLPPDFRWVFQDSACVLWRPMSLDPNPSMDRRSRGLKAVGRLRPGTSFAQAQAEMDVIAAQLAQEHPDPDPHVDKAILLVPIDQDVARFATAWGRPRILVILLAAIISVLLIACLHVASLLLARSATREQEMAVRAALGAHRLRLVRQLLTESLLLAGFGALLGVAFAYWGLGALAAFRARFVPWSSEVVGGRLIPWFIQVHPDGRVLLYAAGISLVTCGLFGVLPAVGASAIRLSDALSRGRMPVTGPRFPHLRSFLVVGDIALTVVLLAGAGLMIHSYTRIMNIDPGYNPRNVLSLLVHLSEEKPPYSQPERRLAFFQEVVERVRALPGVQAVAAANGSPVEGIGNVGAFKIEGVTYDNSKYKIPDLDSMLPDRSYMWFPYWHVFPDYFRLLQIPLVKGRYFTEQDTPTSQPVVIINEALARAFWPHTDPIGKFLLQTPRGAAPIALEIVGVVRGVKHLGRSEPTDPEVYIPYHQSGYTSWMCLMVRTNPARKDVAAAMRKEILSVDPGVATDNIILMDREVAGFFSAQRTLTLCLGGFALVALLLSCMGVYGTMAYVVSRRTHEIGIRMALGARRIEVMGTVVRQGLRLTLLGLAVGLAGALAVTRVIRSLLYDVSPTDPLTLAGVAVLLATATLLACYLPARRAARVDPISALRYE